MKRRSFLKALVAVPLVVKAGKVLGRDPEPRLFISNDCPNLKREISELRPHYEWQTYSQSITIEGLSEEGADFYNRLLSESAAKMRDDIEREIFTKR